MIEAAEKKLMSMCELAELNKLDQLISLPLFAWSQPNFVCVRNPF